MQLEGIIPILLTPFDEQEAIDYAALRQEVEFVLHTGVIGVGFGFASEIGRLTEDERLTLVRAAADQLHGRLPILAPIGADSTRATIARGIATRDAGATWLMVTPPASPGIDDELLFDHYRQVAEQVASPVVVQDAPQHTGVDMSPRFLGRMAKEIASVAGVKVEARPSAPKVAAVAQEVGNAASVLGGAGGLDFFHELDRGASGRVPSAETPVAFVDMYEHHRAGRRMQAWDLFARHLPSCIFAREPSTRTFSRRRRSCGALVSWRLPDCDAPASNPTHISSASSRQC